jgi:HEAT repeat
VSRRDQAATGYATAGDREAYLRTHSGLPGRRGNLELIDVASATTDRTDLERWASLPPEVAPENSCDVFLVCVGTVGLGRIVAAGDRTPLPTLRRLAGDPRWRVREAVAMALQAWGDACVEALLDEMEAWVDGSPLEGRAAMAALCEPRLLHEPATVRRTIECLERLTRSVREAPDGAAADIRVLRQALGYGWSVAIAADVGLGLPAFEPWLVDPDPNVRWIVRSNLAKNRLANVAPGWVQAARARI